MNDVDMPPVTTADRVPPKRCDFCGKLRHGNRWFYWHVCERDEVVRASMCRPCARELQPESHGRFL
jgi:hypothetical protein